MTPEDAAKPVTVRLLAKAGVSDDTVDGFSRRVHPEISQTQVTKVSVATNDGDTHLVVETFAGKVASIGDLARRSGKFCEPIVEDRNSGGSSHSDRYDHHANNPTGEGGSPLSTYGIDD